ncbi:MAG TPA: phenylacetate--CoA ligase [Syntrophales bacterium]|nr:phenylacetate--CoA ligase [Syntrophales bacterium]HOL58367.1 phenylacetate--CoA ligase [Syntrophales bacterium]HPO34536.1 phenylacetate--CoA ligase [Syntrophales bacterium]
MRIWDPLHESMAREDLEQLKLERLQATLNRVYKNVVHYRRLFNEISFVPEDFQSLTDLKKLPFTTREDLQANYPYGMFAVPLREVVRLHAAPGKTSKPIVVGYTKNDIRTWANLVARFMVAAGVDRDDVVQIAFLYGLQTGAFGIHYGAEAIGASVIPMSTGNTEKQVMIMQDYRSTVLVCTPSYALRIAEFMDEHNINPRGLALRLGLFGGEPFPESTREEIESRLGISATDNYGVSEIIGPGIAGECIHKSGLHLFEDAFLPEIVDPQTGEVLPAGSVGELVITTLNREAFPLIRYRTGDITRLDYTPCPCGRTMVRMEKPRGRADDMLIVKGVNVFPSQMEEIISSITGERPNFQVVVDHRPPLAQVELKIEVTEKIFALELLEQKNLLERLQKRIRSVIGINTSIRLVEPGSLAGAASRVRHIS